MKTDTKQQEYIDFWNDLAKKSMEVQAKYDNLSNFNKVRVRQEVEAIFQLHDISEMIKRLTIK